MLAGLTRTAKSSSGLSRLFIIVNEMENATGQELPNPNEPLSNPLRIS
jgi:hypothetical protein